jgi:biotin operon repressor
MNYLVIDGKLLKNKTWTMADKVLLSYIFNLKKAGKKFFGTANYLSSELGASEEALTKRINHLISQNILTRNADGITLAISFEELINYEIEKSNVQFLEKMSDLLENKWRQNNG